MCAEIYFDLVCRLSNDDCSRMPTTKEKPKKSLNYHEVKGKTQ